MLALITHEPNICILREEVFGVRKNISDPFMRQSMKVHEAFEFIYISILREYLILEFQELKDRLKFQFNIERIIDDFVFFCFFIGNDFLPNLNTLDIETGALDYIFTYYKEVLPTLDGYITYHGKIDFTKADRIFVKLAQHEQYNLTQMLRKITNEVEERERKKHKAIQDRKNIIKRKKLNAKKEKFLVKIKDSDEAYIVNFKKDKVNKKIAHYRTRYNKEMLSRGNENFRFEEDINNYLKVELQKNIKKINEPEDVFSSDLNRNESESNTESDVNNKDSQLISNKTKHLAVLFGSDDEGENEKTNNKIADRLEVILKEVSKYDRYIKDHNYCSDVNIDDIEDNDVSAVSDCDTGFELISAELPKEYTEGQDMDKVFQSKLVECYVKDIKQAKAFYYKEKLDIDLDTQKGVEEHRNVFRKYIEGLQWVLYYYYRGVRSWRWFYPYHYAPMISDFERIKEYLDYNMDDNFKPMAPYTPIQSLLFILPCSSRTLIPKCYWNLYEEYPQYFPTKFNIDFNGKKMPWETIVLIPFVPEEPILEFEEKQRKTYSDKACLDNNQSILVTNLECFAFSEKELRRTEHGRSYKFFLDASSKKLFNLDNIVKEVYEVYSETTDPNLESNYQVKEVAYNFPTLNTIEYDYIISSKKNYKSKDKKGITNITLKPRLINNLSEERIISFLRNGVVFILYPFKFEAAIRGILYDNKYYYLDMNNNKVAIDYKYKPSIEAKEYIKRDLNKKCISIDNSDILVDVSTFKRFMRSSDGTVQKLYDASRSFFVPFEITSLNSKSMDFVKILKDHEEFINSYKSISQEFKPSKCLLLNKPNVGQIARFVGLIDNNHPEYTKFNDENYKKHYDSAINYDLTSKDWQIPLDKLYNGPLVEIAYENSLQQSYVNEPFFAKTVSYFNFRLPNRIKISISICRS
jgi:5'-3' exonuclease